MVSSSSACWPATSSFAEEAATMQTTSSSQRRGTDVSHDRCPFDPETLRSGHLALDWPLEECTFMEVRDSYSFSPFLAYFHAECRPDLEGEGEGESAEQPSQSWAHSSSSSSRSSSTHLVLGLGLHKVWWIERQLPLRVLLQAIGEPGGFSSMQRMNTMVVFVRGRQAEHRQLLDELCQEVKAWQERTTAENTFNLYSFSPSCNCWNHKGCKRGRPFETVILPEKVKQRVQQDLEDFFAEETLGWYTDKGITYKRSYLLYGRPGTGKSSLIQAIATAKKRNVCFVQLSHPELTDDGLMQAMSSAPDRALIVLEDVDALFGEGRQRKEGSSCPLSFSGVLNALDGVSNTDGQLFILTTNHVERLDPALIRCGRVDVKIPFSWATVEQVRDMFLHFYPGEEEQAQRFVEKSLKMFGEPKERDEGALEECKYVQVTTATLQQHFIHCRKASAAEAVEMVSFELL
ncbi:Mitochondrial chaperone BCS1 [Balamuthia mandrillaris]